MSYRSLRECIEDLRDQGELLSISEQVDPNLEMAQIHRQVNSQQGPAILFENIKGSPFPAVSNLYGTNKRAEFIFRRQLSNVSKVITLKGTPEQALKRPWHFLSAPFTALRSLPCKVRNGPVLKNQTTIDQLPMIKSWPDDGGAFITLPQVYTEDPERPGVLKSNVGMYRIQLNGNDYTLNKEIGMHYQIHRGIGVHHSKAIEAGKPLRVSIFIGGPPAHTVAAIMPLPEGLSEILFAGMLAGRRFRYATRDGHKISVDADFCIVGTIELKQTKPEGPFGDHLGYYSLEHPFPFLKVEKVYHRDDAIYPFTVVGRPPQEDSVFGSLIHKLTKPALPSTLPGVHELQAVDAAGVHPLLCAVGSERYVPYGPRKPQEIMTIAHSILGFGQASLAKYLLIATNEDRPKPNASDLKSFLSHILLRADWRTDLHFITQTTIDTLDYSGVGLNQGSKIIITGVGEPIRTLSTSFKKEWPLPANLRQPLFVNDGIVCIEAPKFTSYESAQKEITEFCEQLKQNDLSETPLIILCDDSSFTSESLNNFAWVTFTRSNPSHDIYGVDSFVSYKHWGCKGPLVIDARIKPHHAPPLIEDKNVKIKATSLLKTYGF